jgi:hypothetical protein
MRRTTLVLAFSAILTSILFAAAQHPADAACANGGAPGCDELAHGIGQLAEAERRPGIEEWRAREHEFPTELWDKVRVLRTLGLSPAELEDVTNKLMGVVHRYADAEGHMREAERRTRDADDALEKAKSQKIIGEADKHAAEEERGRQLSRFVWVLEDALREFRPPPPPREPRWHPHGVLGPHFRGHCEVDPCGSCDC